MDFLWWLFPAHYPQVRTNPSSLCLPIHWWWIPLSSMLRVVVLNCFPDPQLDRDWYTQTIPDPMSPCPVRPTAKLHLMWLIWGRISSLPATWLSDTQNWHARFFPLPRFPILLCLWGKPDSGYLRPSASQSEGRGWELGWRVYPCLSSSCWFFWSNEGSHDWAASSPPAAMWLVQIITQLTGPLFHIIVLQKVAKGNVRSVKAFSCSWETITTYCFLGSGYRAFVYEHHLLKDFSNVRILVKNIYFGFPAGAGCVKWEWDIQILILLGTTVHFD